VNAPGEEDVCVVAFMRGVEEADPTIAELAALPTGSQAWRSDVSQAWTIEPHQYPDAS
jgi:hypothetical protein